MFVTSFKKETQLHSSATFYLAVLLTSDFYSLHFVPAALAATLSPLINVAVFIQPRSLPAICLYVLLHRALIEFLRQERVLLLLGRSEAAASLPLLDASIFVRLTLEPLYDEWVYVCCTIVGRRAALLFQSYSGTFVILLDFFFFLAGFRKKKVSVTLCIDCKVEFNKKKKSSKLNKNRV